MPIVFSFALPAAVVHLEPETSVAMDTAPMTVQPFAPPPASTSGTDATPIPDPSTSNQAPAGAAAEAPLRDPLPGMAGPSAINQLDPATLRSLVQFANPGIEDITAFFGLASI